MEIGSVLAVYLLRLVGLFGVAVGVAWAMQTFCFGECSLESRLAWTVAAALISGAGVGLVIAARGIGNETGRFSLPHRQSA